MTRIFRVVLMCLGLSWPAPAPLSAMELSLEENRAQRGSAGYVDMVRVFKLYPETARAKESFADAVRQAEEGVNIRKAEILRLRGEVATLKAERGVLDAAAAAEAAAPKPPPAAVPVSSESASIPAAVIAPASTGPIHLPGIPGSTVTAPPPSPPPSQDAASATTAPAPQAPSPAAQALADLDARLQKKTDELARKEEELRNIQSAAEKNLLDLESRKTEILLGKIHRVIMDVARREGISVVVDKNNILYGHEAVDLTEKVIQALRGG